MTNTTETLHDRVNEAVAAIVEAEIARLEVGGRRTALVSATNQDKLGDLFYVGEYVGEGRPREIGQKFGISLSWLATIDHHHSFESATPGSIVTWGSKRSTGTKPLKYLYHGLFSAVGDYAVGGGTARRMLLVEAD